MRFPSSRALSPDARLWFVFLFRRAIRRFPLSAVAYDSGLLCGLATLFDLLFTLDSDKPLPRAVSRLRRGIAGATVDTGRAAGRVAASNPRTRLNRSVMLATKPLRWWWNFEAKHATLIPIPRPPPAPQDRMPMLFAESLLGGWNFRGSIAFAASRVAVTSEPVARSDRSAVNLAEPFFGRR